MRFLPPERTFQNMLPLNLTYDFNSYQNNDVLSIVYKDLDSNQKHVYQIENPQIEIYIVKPEYRDYSHMRDYIELEKCTKHKVRYKYRWMEAAKLLGVDKDSVRRNPYLFNIDMDITTFYLMHFVLEYHTESQRNISLGFLDIENDIIQCDGFPIPGEAPINMVTLVDAETQEVYTLVLGKDNLPNLSSYHTDYDKVNLTRDKFYDQLNNLKADIPGFEKRLNEEFRDVYGDLNYNILIYDDEKELIIDAFNILHSIDKDYTGIWNSPYDIQNFIERCIVLGLDPNEIIADKRFKHKRVLFKEDKNPIAHRRSHVVDLSTITTVLDDMVLHAGINAGRGKLPSLKLNSIAKTELKDEKYNFGEISDIKHIFYDDLIKAIIYNIKDVLLLLGLARKNKNTENIYSRMIQMCVLPNEAFTTTKVVWHALIKFMYKREKKYVPGINRNKGNKNLNPINYTKLFSNISSPDIDTDIIEEDNEMDSFYNNNLFDLLDEFEEDEDSAEDDKKETKRKKFDGAFVANPLHMIPTGFKVMGVLSKYIHEWIGVADVTSEYPTAMVIFNISNETLVAKVFLENGDTFDIPIPEAFNFKGTDKEKYKVDASNMLMESYIEEDPLSLATTFLNLPSIADIIKLAKSKLK